VLYLRVLQSLILILQTEFARKKLWIIDHELGTKPIDADKTQCWKYNRERIRLFQSVDEFQLHLC
jgi:hypothetical protein